LHLWQLIFSYGRNPTFTVNPDAMPVATATWGEGFCLWRGSGELHLTTAFKNY
jgi:hypothetical protein